MSHRSGTEPTWSTIASVIRPVRLGSDSSVGGSLTSRRQGEGGGSRRCARLHQSETTASGRHGGRPAARPAGGARKAPISRRLPPCCKEPVIRPLPVRFRSHPRAAVQGSTITRDHHTGSTTSTQPDRNSHEGKDQTLRRSRRPNQRPLSRRSSLTGVSRVAHRTLSNPHAPATSCWLSTCRREAG